MSLTRKRKPASPNSSSPWSKTRKKEETEDRPPVSQSATCIAEKNATATGQRTVPDAASSTSQSPRHSCPSQQPGQDDPAGQGDIALSPDQAQDGEEPQPCSSPSQHPLLAQEDSDMSLVITLEDEQRRRRHKRRRKGKAKRKRGVAREEGGRAGGPGLGQEGVGREEGPMEVDQIEVEIDRQLDRELESKSRQHNLTSVNVRNIIHEVITNEHVVAMMKAAISETEAMPVFEPKMTRSKLKEVVEKGVVIPTWTISPMKKPNELKPPQFVDIPLEEEDSSDEEYCPDEDEEDETAEETFLESDIESTASSPRGSRSGLARAIMEGDDDRSCSPTQRSHKSRHLRVEVVPMGPPPPPQPAGPPRPPRAPPECSFMEKLHAVEEELAISPICLEPYQNLSGGGGEEGGLMACRTRSKRPLRDVPLGRLEAELRAPDITPDMYDCGSAPEDREWTNWLQGLMTSDMENEEEGDDDDDPEYNFLEDIDEPDVEDYRNDRAVRITKKEVSELMEELFETFRDELGVQDQDEEGHEEEEEREEEAPSQEAPNFNIPQTIRFEEPLANLLTERHRTVREQLAALRRHRALLESQAAEASKNGTPPQVLLLPPSCALMLTHPQKQQLQQQIQQHVQLLTQVHMLSGPVEALQSEVVTTRLFLSELESFAQRGEQARGTMEPGYVSIFRACNLQGALSLLEELKQCPASPASAPTKPVRSAKRGSSLPLLPPKLAWLLATRPVFLYPELLPLCSLDPALHAPRTNSIHTRGEDSLLVLGLRNFSGTMSPYQLVCEYLIRCKEPKQLRRRVFDLSQRRAPDNVIKFYVRQKMVPPMPLACGKVKPDEQRPPVERELKIMPMWLQKSVPFIHKAVMDYNSPTQDGPPQMMTNTAPYTFPPGIRYPPELPETLTLHPSGFRRLRPPSILPNSTPLGQECITEGMGQTIQACAENSTQPVSSRKFLPIKPAPPKPPPPPPKPLQVLTISAGGAVSMLELERGSKTVDKPGAVHHGLPATVIINMAAPLATTVICPARVSEGLARPQGAVARPSTTFAQPRNLGRPLLPAPPKQNPSENGPPICPENATKTNSKPESVSNAETTLILRSPEQVISSVDKLGKEGRTELSISPQKLSAPVGLSAQAPVALSNGSGEAVELRVVQNHLPAISHALAPAPAGGPKNLLLRSTSEGGSHLIFVPQNCVIAEATLPNITAVAQIGRPSPGHVGGSQQGTARHPRKGSAMSPKPDLQNEAKLVEETAPRLASVNPTSRKEKIGQGEGIEGLEEGGEDEEEEEGQYGGDEEEEEEEVGDLGGSPLALSESSESAVSSPGTLQRMEEEEGEGWSGLLASTPQHSPHRGEPGQRGQEWRTTKEEGLTDNIKDGEEDKEEEEVMSLASEESELSVPELQETMEKLSMLASEGMSFGEGDKNDPNSPNSPGSILSHASPNSSVSQNPKETEGLCEGEEPMHREGGSYKSAGKGVSSRGKRRGAGRGRDQSEVKRDGSGCRPHQRLTHRGRKKQGRRGMSKPTPPLNEDDARDSDLAMESQDMAFAQAYLRRVCAAVWEAPGKVDEFLRVLYEFQQGGDRSSLVGLFGQLKSVLKDWPELLQDFAAFLQPEQARECGLLVEQQAFERSRRFLRQLEMSFEESPAHFQRIVHALQEGPSLTPAGLREMKSQIASLLKNHTHLQTEFWEFFDDIIASSQSVCPEGVAPSDATASQRPRRGARRRLNEVTHPVSEEGEESQKLGTPKKEEGPVCDWSVGGKDRPYRGSKRAAKPRRVSRKHGAVSRRKRGELSSPGSSTLPRGLHPEKRVGRRGEERRKRDNGVNIPHPAKEREEETEDVREKKEQEASQHEGRGGAGDDTPASQPNSVNSSPNPPVCAQNVSLMPTGEKVILWTREADRMILTACQQKGAKHSTFKTVSTQLGNKTANEVSLRFQELMRLFHTTSHPARDADHQAASDDDPD